MSFLNCVSNCDKIVNNLDSIIFNYTCTNTTECKPIQIFLQKGVYHFHLFGASGGGDDSTSSVRGGYGGEVEGLYRVNHRTKFYLYIGGMGETGKEVARGGFNGGGDGAYGYNAGNIGYVFGGGGGSTDIRTKANIESRIAVAGGGGGAGYDTLGASKDVHGGDGGGLTGKSGGYGVYVKRCGLGGNQSSGGSGGNGTIELSSAENGEPLNGGNGLSKEGSHAGGGGGGYMGGGGAYEAGGGGGSSYIDLLFMASTKEGVNHGNGYIIIKPIFIDQCSVSDKLNLNFHLFLIIISMTHSMKSS